MKSEAISRNPRTLVVDDHDISSRYTVAALRQFTTSVKHAENAREAVSKALGWLPDLICTDLRLPDGNGLDVIRQIRTAWPATRTQPAVIMLTADAAGVDESELAELGVSSLLLKPVSAENLRKAARLHHINAVNETSRQGEYRLELQSLLEEELERRLPELDNCMAALDLPQAHAILHQLIASSAICGERRLERNLRRLDAACRESSGTSVLAAAYFEVLESVRVFCDEVCRDYVEP